MKFFFSLLLLASVASAQYQASWTLDVPLALSATGAQVFGQWRLAHMDPVSPNEFSKQDLLPWDRPFAGNYNPTAAKVTDYATVLGATPLALSLWDWRQERLAGEDVWVDVLMLYEALMLQSGLNLTVRSLRVWPRPLYWSDASADVKGEGEVSGSFFSGHSSSAFTIASFTSTLYQQRHPDSPWKPVVWGASFGTAALVASLRVVAGKHYPTDIVTGAVVGSFTGWLIPVLHKKEAHATARLDGSSAYDFSVFPLGNNGIILQCTF